MSRHPRSATSRLLSEHRLRPAAAERIIASTGLAPPELVFEFGAGDGALTGFIAERCRRVVAIEVERERWLELRGRFRDNPRVQPVLADFLAFQLPQRGGFTIISNVPYSLTAALFRRLLGLENPPRAAHLVLQREAAAKWTGTGHDSLDSILLKNRFHVGATLAIHRREFDPRPNADSVLISLARRGRPVFAGQDTRRFEAFVRRGFSSGRGSVARNIGGSVGGRGLRAVLEAHGLDLDAQPHHLSFEAWAELFRGR